MERHAVPLVGDEDGGSAGGRTEKDLHHRHLAARPTHPVKVSGRWCYVYRAIDQHGQVIDVLISQNRDLATTHQFFTRALEHGPRPAEVSTDRAPLYPRVLDELLVSACHVVEQYATPSKPIMVGSNPGRNRCVASNGSARLE
jgi:hypothetical protein